MEKRIELEKRGRPANQVTELILDNCRSTSIVGLTDDFTALETLSLINVGLTTLKGFPTLPSLKKLELSDNRISSGLSHLATSTKLTHLNLSGNKIKDLEELKALEKFQSLLVLDLFNNEATSIDSYREKIFALIPSLKYLDGFDVDEVEALSDGEEDDDLNGNDSDGEDVSDDGVEGAGEEDDDEDDDDDDEDDEEDDEVSLAEVYNDNLDELEDHSDYVEEGEEEEDDDEDDDEESDEDDAPPASGGAKAGAKTEAASDGAKTKKSTDEAEEAAADDEENESPVRGKKRKHDN